MPQRSAEWPVAERAWGLSEPEPEVFRFGPWSWERRGDELADICFERTVVLRMVRVVTRDRDWNTVPVTVTAVRTSDHGIELDLHIVGFGAELTATVEVTAGETLGFAVTGTSHAEFERNRLGFVVLHPPTVAGAQLTVISPDGTQRQTRFPERVSAHQPAFDIAGLRWRTAEVACELKFKGEIFEMEDQRNWTDASFKTYSTPLAEPFPVRLEAGARFHQEVVLSCERIATVSAETHSLVRLDLRGTVPDVVVGASSAPGWGPTDPAIPAAAILVEVEAGQESWRGALERATRAGLPLDVRLVVSDVGQVDEMIEALVGTNVCRVGVFDAKTHVTESPLWNRLKAALELNEIDAEVVAGTRAHFTELNRSADRLIAAAASVTFSITPEMHARERSQLVESIPMQTIVARDAALIAEGRPLHVGPVTLGPRFNAVATSAPTSGPPSVVDGYGSEFSPGANDIRQQSSAAAAWTVASVCALAEAASICYFEEWGSRGLMDSSGQRYPVFDAIELVHSLRGRQMLLPAVPEPRLHVFGALSPTTLTVVAANLSGVERRFAFESDYGSGQLSVPPYGIEQTELPAPPVRSQSA